MTTYFRAGNRVRRGAAPGRVDADVGRDDEAGVEAAEEAAAAVARSIA